MRYLLTYERTDGDYDVLAAFDCETLGDDTAEAMAVTAGITITNRKDSIYSLGDLCVFPWEGDVPDLICPEAIEGFGHPTPLTAHIKRMTPITEGFAARDEDGAIWYWDSREIADGAHDPADFGPLYRLTATRIED